METVSTSEYDKWISLLMGEISTEEAAPLLSKGVADLQTFLETHPQAEQQVLDIIRRRLGDNITTTTWQPLLTSLTNYFGLNLAYLMAWVAQYDQRNRIEELEKYNLPQVTTFLRTILGLYGLEMENAFAVWERLPDDWRMFNREIYYDQIKQRHYVRVRIEKYNGQDAIVESYPDGILELTSFFIRTLLMVGTPNAFSQRYIDMFFDEASQLVKFLLPEEEKGGDELPESEPTGEEQNLTLQSDNYKSDVLPESEPTGAPS